MVVDEVSMVDGAFFDKVNGIYVMYLYVIYIMGYIL